jgi:hypothetical protein
MRTLMLLLIGLISCSVLAQSVKTNKPVACVTPEFAAQALELAGEAPVFNDDNLMTNKQSAIVLLRNERTGTWTLLEFQQGLACILGHGVQQQV